MEYSIWEHDPHEIADDVDRLSDQLGRQGKYQDAATLSIAAEMIRDMWDSSFSGYPEDT